MAIRHIVLFKFKPTVSAAEVASLEAEFAGLRGKIGAIQALEWGTNASEEGLTKGFTHCFTLTFAGTAERAAYLPHPLHQAFVVRVLHALDDVLVLDYTV